MLNVIAVAHRLDNAARGARRILLHVAALCICTLHARSSSHVVCFPRGHVPVLAGCHASAEGRPEKIKWRVPAAGATLTALQGYRALQPGGRVPARTCAALFYAIFTASDPLNLARKVPSHGPVQHH